MSKLTGKYKCRDVSGGYEHNLIEGKVYDGEEQPGIFADRPFLIVYDDKGEEITAAHLYRFERVTGC